MKNIYFLLTTNICENVPFLRILYFIEQLIKIVCFIIPMLLIVITTINLSKNIIANKEDEMTQNLRLVIKKIINCMIIFLIPGIVEFAINTLGNFNVDFKNCTKITLDKIEKQIKTNKAECEKNQTDYEWNETNATCNLKIKSTTQTTTNNNKSGITYSKSNTTNNTNNDTTTTNSEKKTTLGSFTYYGQADGWGNNCTSKSTMRSSGCGITAVAIVANAFNTREITPATVRDYLCKHGHSGGALDDKWLENKEFLNYLQLSSKKIISRNNEDKYKEYRAQLIKKSVDEGYGVILLIPGHFVTIGPNKSCKSNQVYLYDVGKKANNGCYTMKELWNKTHNYKGRCPSKCGWRAAWVLKKK